MEYQPVNPGTPNEARYLKAISLLSLIGLGLCLALASSAMLMNLERQEVGRLFQRLARLEAEHGQLKLDYERLQRSCRRDAPAASMQMPAMAR